MEGLLAGSPDAEPVASGGLGARLELPDTHPWLPGQSRQVGDVEIPLPARLDSGCVWVNCHIPLVAEMPHGGFKQSGYGKDLSLYGLEDYTRIKHVMSSIEP